jgi:hypothetical protein
LPALLPLTSFQTSAPGGKTNHKEIKMIKISQKEIEIMEHRYPGIKEQIQHFEAMDLPACPICGSSDTASVQAGVIGRTILITAATTKFHLTPNYNGKGRYFCNVCKKQFKQAK